MNDETNSSSPYNVSPYTNQSTEPFYLTMQSADGAGFSSTGGGPSATEKCPLMNQRGTDPCFIQSVDIVKSTSGPKVSYVHGDYEDSELPKAVRDHLGGDDLLLQVIANYRDIENTGTRATDIFFMVNMGAACGDHSGAAHTVNNGGFLTEGTDFGQSTHCEKVLSKPPPKMWQNLWEHVWPFDLQGLNTYKLYARSCGVPNVSTDTAPQIVVGRVEVYRKSSAKLILKTPPRITAKAAESDIINLRKKERTRSISASGSLTTLDGKTSSFSAKASRTRGVKRNEQGKIVETGEGSDSVSFQTANKNKDGSGSSESRTISKDTKGGTKDITFSEARTVEDGVIVIKARKETWSESDTEDRVVTEDTTKSERQHLGGAVKRTTVDSHHKEQSGTEVAEDDYHGGLYERAFMGEILPTESDDTRAVTEFQKGAKLLIDGKENDALKLVSALLILPQNVRQMIKDIQDVVPKIGWWAALDFSMFEGSLELETWVDESTEKLHDRVWVLTREGKIAATVTVFKVSISIVFGFEMKIDNPFSTYKLVEVALTVSFGTDVVGKIEGSYSTREGEKVLNGTVSNTPFAKADGTAMFQGYGVKAEAKISFGLEGGLYMKASASKPLSIKLELKRKGLALTYALLWNSDPVYDGSMPILGEASEPLATLDIVGDSKSKTANKGK